ncbi:MAG: nucleotide-diphospho-sugar transferase [Flavobacteriales bacterium]|nr:nucleotide-diphospho-sugar transferase [Flavobacteriales bacterium]MBP9079481.1 nucleotide-diphospho-sugar transferase [Flavobacteriales bacterium]
MNTKPLNTAVLFIAFNREEPSRMVMEAIRQAKPPRLYFACDGARTEQEREKCERVRSLVSMVDWDCRLHTRFSDVNQGVMMGESTAMDWFFEQEEEGIILEDDTCPDPSFFPFCEELLERYRHDHRVWCIMGNNLMTEWDSRGDASYYFSAHGYGAYWGWAGWRRVWKKYDVEMRDWPACRDGQLLNGHFLSKAEMAEAYKLFQGQYEGHIRSWDYQMDFARIINRGITCIPNINLVRNIGFGADGTHTVSENDRRNKSDLSAMAFPLVHPRFMVVDAPRDLAYFERYIQPSLFRKLKDAVKNFLPDKLDEAITPFLSKVQKRLGLN